MNDMGHKLLWYMKCVHKETNNNIVSPNSESCKYGTRITEPYHEKFWTSYIAQLINKPNKG